MPALIYIDGRAIDAVDAETEAKARQLHAARVEVKIVASGDIDAPGFAQLIAKSKRKLRSILRVDR